jgi:hypothetical protein
MGALVNFPEDSDDEHLLAEGSDKPSAQIK